MAQVILDAETDLLDLVEQLETHQEDVIFLEKDGVPIIEMRLTQQKTPAKPKPNVKRIGIAKGKIHVPDDFDKWELF